MIDESKLEIAIGMAAASAACTLFGDDEVDRALSVLFVSADPAPALTLAHALGAMQGRALFVALARRKALTVDEDQWPNLPEAAAFFFEFLARFSSAFANPVAARADDAVVKVVPASRVRPRDKIFERMGGKADAFERTGGRDLSPGQPTSTAEVTVERPQDRPPVNQQQAMLDAKFAAAGLRPPIGPDDAGDAADYVAGRLASRAPPAPPPQRVNVNRFVDGVAVHGDVFISRPGRLAANAPAPLRADESDAGPEEE